MIIFCDLFSVYSGGGGGQRHFGPSTRRGLYLSFECRAKALSGSRTSSLLGGAVVYRNTIVCAPYSRDGHVWEYEVGLEFSE